MEKLLTISVAAYNVEKYIKYTLDSLLLDDVLLQKLEIFVIDDGGTDSTLEIAKTYENKYSGVVYAVHKDDDGYGSTVNYSLERATGKYFKLLDGDDWFVTENLRKILELLETIDEDVLIDDFYKCPGSENYNYINAHDYKEGDVLDVHKFNPNIPVGMWALIYKTSLLKEISLKLPENMFYVDQIYSTYPFEKAKKIRFLKMPLYCYRVGQDGQSVSRESRIKYASQMEACCMMLLEFCEKCRINKCKNYDYILNRVSRYYQTAFRTILLKPINSDNKNELIEFEMKSKLICADVFTQSQKYGKGGKLIKYFRMSKYQVYWLLKFYPMPNWK